MPRVSFSGLVSSPKGVPKDPMGEYELVSLLREFGGVISEQFNFWMATTFAVVIASHTAGHALSRKIRIAIALLYVPACFTYFLHCEAASDVIFQIHEDLSALDSNYVPGVTGIGSIGSSTLMVGGSLLAILLVLRRSIAGGERSLADSA